MFSHRFRYVYILLLAVYSFLNIIFTGGENLFSFQLDYFYFFVAILLVVLLIWESNHLLFRYLSTISTHFKRLNVLVVFFLLSLVSVLIISIASSFVLTNWTTIETSTITSQFRLSLAFTFRINLFLHTLHAIWYYNSRLKDSLIESERLKTLTAESQYSALRNQIKPHFLFNSFNVLSGLVDKDPPLAQHFINQLSRVYRYLLYHQQTDLVSLDTELEYLDSYFSLLQVRFGSALVIQNNTEFIDAEKYWVPPSSLQLLVENAIKHNVISKKKQLTVNIFEENGFIVVCNNLQPKSQTDNSSGLGLDNVRLRFRYLTDQKIVVEQKNDIFTVKLPLILQPSNESSYR